MAGALYIALDQVIGVFGWAHQAQAQRQRIGGPASVAEKAQHDLGHGLGALLGERRGRGIIGPGGTRQQQQDG
ncbi:hypothetical protein D3C71_1954190 [compost metagenome]